MWGYIEEEGKRIRALKNTRDRNKQFKIVALGDSLLTGAYGVQGFSSALEAMLKQAHPEINFEMAVFAAGGYSTQEEVACYDIYAKDWAPNLVILSYCHNDTAEVHKRVIKKDNKTLLVFYKSNIAYIDKIPFNRSLTERFLLARMINEEIIKFFLRYNIPHEIKFCLLRDEKIYGALKELSALTNATHTQVAVVIFPHLGNFFDASHERMRGLISQWCAEFDFLNIDLTQDFKRLDPAQLRVREGDTCHLNALGYNIATKSIFKKITENFFRIDR